MIPPMIKIEYEWLRRAFLDAETPDEEAKVGYLLREYATRPFPGTTSVPYTFIPEKTLLAIMEAEIEHRNRLQVMPTSVPAMHWILDKISRMKVGQRLSFHPHELDQIPPLHHKGCVWTPADRVIENILGGAYVLSYRVRGEDGVVTFQWHPDTGARHYLSPDHPERRKGHYVY